MTLCSVKNKKIQNAEKVIDNGIMFRSRTERMMYNTLISLGYTPEFEPDTFTIWEGFYPKNPLYIDGVPQYTKPRKNSKKFIPKIPKFRDWTYTPDFKLTLGKNIFYIECKGYGNDLWSYKLKLFLKHIEDKPNIHFYICKTKKGLLTTLKLISEIYEKENTDSNDGGINTTSS